MASHLDTERRFEGSGMSFGADLELLTTWLVELIHVVSAIDVHFMSNIDVAPAIVLATPPPPPHIENVSRKHLRRIIGLASKYYGHANVSEFRD